MKKLCLFSFLICFVFASFAKSVVTIVPMGKYKTEKVSFEAVAPTVIKKALFVSNVEVSFTEHRIQETSSVISSTESRVTHRFTYNYSYPWCRNQKDVVWLIDIYK